MAELSGETAYTVDGLTPSRTVRVTSVEELSEALKQAHGEGLAVVPWGGGTRIHVGNMPAAYDIALDLTELASSIQHEAGDLTVIADAGVRIADLNALLAEQGQRLPFDVKQPTSATLGGSVASNSPGRTRSSFGGIRDWLIGMQIVLADGTVTKSGGRVVKNVQGYDMHRLHTGAFGTLGVISEVGLKVVPIPARSSTVAAWFSSVEEAGELTTQIFNGPSMPEALTIFSGNSASRRLATLDAEGVTESTEALVLARISGGEKAVERMQNDLTGMAGALGALGYQVLNDPEDQGAWEPDDAGATSDGIECHVTLKPGDALSYAASLSARSDRASLGVELQAGFGTVSVSMTSGKRSDIDLLRDAAARFGANVVIERCPTELKREIDVFGDMGSALSIMRSTKQRFDPTGVLNRGRFAGGI